MLLFNLSFNWTNMALLHGCHNEPCMQLYVFVSFMESTCTSSCRLQIKDFCCFFKVETPQKQHLCVHGFGEGENVECCIVGGWRGWWGLQGTRRRRVKKSNNGFELELLGGGNDNLMRQWKHVCLVEFSFEIRCKCYMLFGVNESDVLLLLKVES